MLDNKLDPDTLSEKLLPQELQKMSEAERVDYVREKVKVRQKSMKKLKELNALREEHIQKEMEEMAEESSFSRDLHTTMKRQAASKGIRLK